MGILDNESIVADQILARLGSIEARLANLETRLSGHDQALAAGAKAGAKRMAAVVSVLLVVCEAVRGYLAPISTPPDSSEQTHGN